MGYFNEQKVPHAKSMDKASHVNLQGEGSSLLKRLAFASSIICLLGLYLWFWIENNRALLPNPNSNTGKNLAGQYIYIAYDSFLVILFAVLIILTRQVILANSKPTFHSSPKKPPSLKPLLFAKNNPIITIIFAAYTIILLNEATWFHGEMMGWMKELFEGNLLNNFSIRYEFVNETLRRTDYRLFPLAHQDLHILSWFTPYVKVFMLASAAELITICILSARFIEKIAHRKNIPSILLISSLLLLFNASVGNAFFELHFAERMVTFIFSIYCLTFLHYQREKGQASFYLTILMAILGIFFKDISFILFITPPAIVIALRMLSLWEDDKSSATAIQTAETFKSKWNQFYYRNKLELWLCYLFLSFATVYIFLSLIPSTYLASESYADKSTISTFNPDVRFWILILISSIRYVLILLKRIKANLLDAINAASILYAIALYLLISIEGYSYLYLPFVFASVLNVLWIWSAVSGKLGGRIKQKNIIGALGISGSFLIIGLEHIDINTSFYGHASRVHELHNSWEDSYKQIDELTRSYFELGREVNLIYSDDSWFSDSRHLNRLRYHKLIEWNPGSNGFKVKDGIGAESNVPYIPKQGDLFINIDRTGEPKMYPTIPLHSLNVLYIFEHRESDRTNGQIFEIRAIK